MINDIYQLLKNAPHLTAPFLWNRISAAFIQAYTKVLRRLSYTLYDLSDWVTTMECSVSYDYECPRSRNCRQFMEICKAYGKEV